MRSGDKFLMGGVRAASSQPVLKVCHALTLCGAAGQHFQLVREALTFLTGHLCARPQWAPAPPTPPPPPLPPPEPHLVPSVSFLIFAYLIVMCVNLYVSPPFPLLFAHLSVRKPEPCRSCAACAPP